MLRFHFILCKCLVVTASLFAQQRDTLLRIEASPAQGFNFPCYIYIPTGCSPLFEMILMVEPNNTGFVNDTFAVHDEAARVQATLGPLGNYLSRKLKVPLLVPVFPRSQKQWKIYTQMMDRDVMRIRKGSLKRLDLQLLAMISAAREKLYELNFRTQQKILMCGYSSSGVFSNRFACLHPEVVKAYSAGGINGLLMMPFSEKEGVNLDYPLGTHDFQKITGDSFDLKTFQEVRQFLYLGAEDTNDAVMLNDGYNNKERKAIFAVLGKQMQPDRWNKTQTYYKAATSNVEFHTYAGMGHGINEEIYRDLVRFYRDAIRK